MCLFSLVFMTGWVGGVVTAAFIAVVLAYFRKPLIQTLAHMETTLSRIGPGPKGFIIDPEPEADIMRREHVRKNAERGRDTPIQELL